MPVPPSKPKPSESVNQQTEEILNSILPPRLNNRYSIATTDRHDFFISFREWTEKDQLWVQQVSATPATRLDVVNIQEELDRRLQQRQARETGICPVRRELYSQVIRYGYIDYHNFSDNASINVYR